MNTDDPYFIRTDADRIVYDGMLRALQHAENRNDLWIEGKYYDYFMNRLRGGTPHVIPRKAMKLLASDNSLMPNSKKPESDFSKYLKSKSLVDFKHLDTITNLHDFEQYPSKVCNTFLNRLKRGHGYLYDNSYLNTLPAHYKIALQHAVNVFESKNYENKDSMDFADFSFLDDAFSKSKKIDIDSTYNELEKLYDSLEKSIK